MTAKRFILTDTDYIFDRETGAICPTLESVVKLLNELSEENEQLRNNIKEVKAYNNWLVAVLEDTGAIVEIKKGDFE